MKILIEIENESIRKNDISHECVIDCIYSGIYYMMRVVGNYNIADNEISVKEV